MSKTYRTLIVALMILIFSAVKPLYAQDYMRIGLSDGSVMDIAISDIEKLTFDFSVGLQHHPELIQQLLKLKLYPNPAKEIFMIDYTLPDDGSVNIEIYNLAGAMVFAIDRGHQQSGDHRYQINSRQLKAGTYLIRVQQNSRNVIEKIIVKP